MSTSFILLGSGSPRRRALLESAGLKVAVHPTGASEQWPDAEGAKAVELLARRKMEALVSSWPARVSTSATALTADTVVFCDESPLNKPETDEHAMEMLRCLSGRSHDVVTAFCAKRPGRELWLESVRTRVWFRSLRNIEIERYVSTGEPRDKAGAYGIQGKGGAFVERLDGSYTNVVGLPLSEVLRALGMEQ